MENREVAAPGVAAEERCWVDQQPLVGDASTRRYERLWAEDGSTAVRVRYPPGAAGALAHDLAVMSWLETTGLRVPAVLHADVGACLAVLEDFGAADAEQTLREARDDIRQELVVRLVRPLQVLARVPPSAAPAFNTPLDLSRLRWELAGFELWFCCHHCGRRPDAQLGQWLDELAERVALHPTRVCHRDYHLNNLFLLPDGEVGVIDAQDMLVGPDTYDAVSLLEERAMPVLLSGSARQEFLAEWERTTDPAPGWELRWQETRMQRALKIVGTFSRLSASGRPGYDAWLEAVISRLLDNPPRLPVPAALLRLLRAWTPGDGPS